MSLQEMGAKDMYGQPTKKVDFPTVLRKAVVQAYCANSDAEGMAAADRIDAEYEAALTGISDLILRNDALAVANKVLLDVLIEVRENVRSDSPEMWQRVDAAIALGGEHSDG